MGVEKTPLKKNNHNHHDKNGMDINFWRPWSRFNSVFVLLILDQLHNAGFCFFYLAIRSDIE
jgi:hypothetical protein